MKNKIKAPVNKNDDITLLIDDYTSEGYGIGRIDGFVIFVPFALAGETVNVHILKVSKSYAIGKLINKVTENNDIKQIPACEVYYACGGCDMQHMNYPQQLVFKQNRVYNALKRIANLDDINVPCTIAADSQYEYRNKASFPFGFSDGKTRLGFYAPRSHRLIPITTCPIQKSDTIKAMQTVEKWANKYKISPFNEETGDGILRHLVVRSTEELLVTIVTSGSALPYKQELIQMLKDEFPNLAGIVHNINSKITNVILGSSYTTIYGKDSLTETIAGLKFTVRTPSFLQVNHEQTEKLYNTALSFLNIGKNDTVFDIYCGIGTITLMLAKKAGNVIGIEYVGEAVEDARQNAKQNGITNAEFIVGAAEEVLPHLVEKGVCADAIVIDPPRHGCDEAVLSAIAKSDAKQLVYVSCNPETLARDIKILLENGFCLEKVQPVDMFPQTNHVETVCLLTRIK